MSGERMSVGSAVTRVSLLLALLAGLSCTDKEELDYAPPNCRHSKPETGSMIAEVSLNPQNPWVPLKIYLGDVDENHLVLEDTLRTHAKEYLLGVDEYYSVTVRYLHGEDTVLVMDGGDLDAKEEEFRDATCWWVKDLKLDLRLRI